jgi:hypothetical protein
VDRHLAFSSWTDWVVQETTKKKMEGQLLEKQAQVDSLSAKV